MDMNIIQNMRQEQKLILTNEMKLSLQLLQIPIIELQDLIEKSLDENPILEIDYENLEDTVEQDIYDSGKMKDEFDYEKLLRINVDNSYGTFLPYSVADEDIDSNPFQYISKTKSLKDYLLEQIIDINDNKEMHNICKYLIELIDKDGFLTDDIHDISYELNQPVDRVQSALLYIQDLQPFGIGARDYKESLIIQLKKKDYYDITVGEIIEKHLDLLAENKLKELSKILGISLEKLQQYVSIIKTLEPKPGRGFYTGENTGYVIPEAFLKKVNNDYYIIMNDSILPRLNVNPYYQKLMKGNNNQDVTEFMKDKVSSALSLIKGIEQRRQTIYRIIEKIVDYQRDFFDKGNSYLKPMNLKDLAQDLNLHESTVSRAIKDKFIIVPNGTIRLKDLFTNGITTNGVNDISTNTIKIEIEELIKSEDKAHPLSDQEISIQLTKSNKHISRRTVAKYREALGIRSSSKRKIFVTNNER